MWTKELLIDSMLRKKGQALKTEKSLLKIRMKRGDITQQEYNEIIEETKEYYKEWKDFKEPKRRQRKQGLRLVHPFLPEPIEWLLPKHQPDQQDLLQ